MKKILYLHSGAELYGADQILIKIVSNINKNEYKPIVVLPNDGPLVEKLKDKNIDTRIISYPIVRRKYFNPVGLFNYLKEYKKSCKKIIKLIKEENIDIIHSNTIAVLEGIYIKKKTKKKLIIHIHEMLEHPKIVAKVLYKLTTKNADKVVVVSNSVKQHIENILKNKKENIEVIHNGIEIENYENVDFEYLYNEFNIPKNAIIIGTIGRINAIKGQQDFIEVMDKIIKEDDNVYGVIVGDAFKGQEWRINELKSKIKELDIGSKIIYAGFRNDISNIQNFINIYVLSSVQKDSFPTVVLEAMASNTPIVAYKCGGVEEMVNDSENGFLVNVGEKEKLKEKIKLLIDNNDLRKKFGEESLKIINEKFGINNFIENVEKMYKSLE